MEIILTVATILGGITALWFFYDKYMIHKKSKSLLTLNENLLVNNETSIRNESIRDIDDNKHLKFIDSLPEEKMIVYQNAQKKWDTGITSEMREGNYNVIDFLKETWLKLSEFYEDKNFEDKKAQDYISDYVKSRFDYHYSKHTPKGEFKSGTIVYVMVGGDVIDDLDILVLDLVSTISFYNDSFDYNDWKNRWAISN